MSGLKITSIVFIEVLLDPLNSLSFACREHDTVHIVGGTLSVYNTFLELQSKQLNNCGRKTENCLFTLLYESILSSL